MLTIGYQINPSAWPFTSGLAQSHTFADKVGLLYGKAGTQPKYLLTYFTLRLTTPFSGSTDRLFLDSFTTTCPSSSTYPLPKCPSTFGSFINWCMVSSAASFSFPLPFFSHPFAFLLFFTLNHSKISYYTLHASFQEQFLENRYNLLPESWISSNLHIILYIQLFLQIKRALQTALCAYFGLHCCWTIYVLPTYYPCQTLATRQPFRQSSPSLLRLFGLLNLRSNNLFRIISINLNCSDRLFLCS